MNPKKSRAICFCGGEAKRFGYKFCTNRCQMNFQYEEFIRRWKQGLESGLTGKKKEVSAHIRRYLFEKHKNSCQQCGWSIVHEQTNKVPLQIHHVDGDFTNNRPKNLMLLCPNCHSLTNSFGGLNKKGMGRRTSGCF